MVTKFSQYGNIAKKLFLGTTIQISKHMIILYDYCCFWDPYNDFNKLSSKYNIHRAKDEDNIVLQGQLNQYIDKIIAIIVL